MPVIDNGCKMPCIPWVEEAVELQKMHLLEAGHHQDAIVRVVLAVLGRLNTTIVEKPVVKNVGCVPYYHGISHNFTSVSKRFGLNLVFKVRNKLEWLTPFLGGTQGC